MSYVTPFRALTYNPEMFHDATAVITPPYDNIPAGDEKKYWNRSPYNFAHLDLPKVADDNYEHSAHTFQEWTQKGILKETSGPCYFLYDQTFEAYGKQHSRRTLMATVQLHEFSEGIVRPHENTHGKHKADRLQIQRATKANFSHIFGMVKDEEGFLGTLFEKWSYEKVFFRGKSDDGCEHSLWKIEGAKAKEVTEFFENQPIYIVDGHHRYESAVQYAREQEALGKREHPAGQMLFAIANAFDPGLVVFPTHRLVRSGSLKPLTVSQIEHSFILAPMGQEDLKRMVETPVEDPEFGLYFQGKLYLARPKSWLAKAESWGMSIAKLPVTWSDQILLRDMGGIGEQERAHKILYDRDFNSAWNKRNECDLVVFQPRPSVTDVINVADEKRFMPQKSTYFYPKLAAGFVVRKL
jgi:uncharacterized protein (DUF1015 family)